ncbi:hypothetical protein ACOSQ2_017401 [Xanthoceras sorbifolium]
MPGGVLPVGEGVKSNRSVSLGSSPILSPDHADGLTIDEVGDQQDKLTISTPTIPLNRVGTSSLSGAEGDEEVRFVTTIGMGYVSSSWD